MDVTAARVVDEAVARTVAAQTARVVRLAEASPLPPAGAKVAAARRKLGRPAKTADRVKRGLRGGIVLPAQIAHRVRNVLRARTAGRVRPAREAIGLRVRRARPLEIALRGKSARRPTIAGGVNRVLRSTIAGLARNHRCSGIAVRAPIVAATAIVVDVIRASPRPRPHSPLAIRARPSRRLRSRVESRRASMTAMAVAAGAGEVAAAAAVIVTSAGRRRRARRCLRFPQ